MKLTILKNLIKVIKPPNKQIKYIPIGPFDRPPQITPYTIKFPFGQK